MVNKYIKNTVGVVVAGVGISEANKLPMFGSVLGTSIEAGLLQEQIGKKKKGGLI